MFFGFPVNQVIQVIQVHFPTIESPWMGASHHMRRGSSSLSNCWEKGMSADCYLGDHGWTGGKVASYASFKLLPFTSYFTAPTNCNDPNLSWRFHTNRSICSICGWNIQFDGNSSCQISPVLSAVIRFTWWDSLAWSLCKTAPGHQRRKHTWCKALHRLVRMRQDLLVFRLDIWDAHPIALAGTRHVAVH